MRLLDTTSLGPALGVAEATEDELYAAMDWLLERQQSIEEGLARRYLTPGGVVLYDLTSTYVGPRRPKSTSATSPGGVSSMRTGTLLGLRQWRI